MNRSAKTEADRKALAHAMNLSLITGVFMLVIKVGAYWLTGSAAILSDAAESIVHVAAVIFAAYSLRLCNRPPDAGHLYGHAKISFFSAGFEGAMIILAALYIIYKSVYEWIEGVELENLGAGTVLTALAAGINGWLGAYLLWLGRRKKSVILEANGKHVLTDCWTSIAVLIGLALVLLTKWMPFDPICGIAMACNILWSGGGLIRSGFAGLMDTADPDTHKMLAEVLDRETAQRGLRYHELRHRSLGDGHWVEVHLLFPGGVLLAHAHRMATEIEQAIEQAIASPVHVTTHLESAVDHETVHPSGEPPSDPGNPVAGAPVSR